jgi:hypothetical protein
MEDKGMWWSDGKQTGMRENQTTTIHKIPLE